MPREKADYRAVYEALNAKFPDQFELSVTDMAAFIGCDRRTAKKRYPLASGRTTINKSAFARRLAT